MDNESEKTKETGNFRPADFISKLGTKYISGFLEPLSLIPMI